MIDVQTHRIPPGYIAHLREVAGRSGRPAEIATGALANPLTMSNPVLTGEIDQRIELIDRAGVDMHALSFPAQILWSDDVEPRVCATEALNDGLTEIVRKHPDRFAALASLPASYAQASIAETGCVRRAGRPAARASRGCSRRATAPTLTRSS